MGHVCHSFSRVSIILTFSLTRLCSLKILVRPKNFVKSCLRETFLLMFNRYFRLILIVTAQIFLLKRSIFCDSKKIKFVEIGIETREKQEKQSSSFFQEIFFK